MQFSSLNFQLPILAALFLGAASAVDMQAWQGSGCDVGASVYWSNVGTQCVTIPLSFGLRYFNVPAGAKGQAYYDSHCTNYAQGGGQGTYCLDAHNNMRSTNWFYNSSKFIKREPEVEMTSGVQYTCPDGQKRIIVAPADFDAVIALINDEDWEKLATYPADPNLAPADRYTD